MDKLKQAVSDVLDTLLSVERQEDGTFSCEIYSDYRDEMGDKTAIKISRSEYPMQTFWEHLDEWYQDYQWELGDELEKEVRAKLTATDGPYPEGFSDEDDDRMLDTLYGKYGEPIDPKAGIAWLAKTQGYTRGRLKRALQEGDMAEPKGFLQSMRVELANLSSAMSTVTFLVELTLEQLIELNRLVRLQDRDGVHYDSRKNPYCGYIIIDKSTETGLYDPWNGGGSVFEIQLEKDVKLPIKYIRSALPDGGDGHSVGSVYGMCGSAWTRGGVKTIHAPVKMAA